MMKFRTFYRKARHLIGWPAPYTTVTVEAFPDMFEFETVYLVGDDGNYWFAGMDCPCGCGEKIQLSLLPNKTAQWKVTEHSGGAVTLHPSVWRQIGCKSHYWFRKGKVQWCENLGQN